MQHAHTRPSHQFQYAAFPLARQEGSQTRALAQRPVCRAPNDDAADAYESLLCMSIYSFNRHARRPADTRSAVRLSLSSGGRLVVGCSELTFPLHPTDASQRVYPLTSNDGLRTCRYAPQPILKTLIPEFVPASPFGALQRTQLVALTCTRVCDSDLEAQRSPLQPLSTAWRYLYVETCFSTPMAAKGLRRLDGRGLGTFSIAYSHSSML